MEIYSWFKNKDTTNEQYRQKNIINENKILNDNMWPKAQVKSKMIIKKINPSELVIDDKNYLRPTT